MGNRKGLTILTLIFSLIGMGLGGYVFVTNTILPMFGEEDEPTISNTWFVYNMAGDLLGNGIYTHLDSMVHNITINQSENLYILFTCYLRFTTTATEAYYAIYLDNDLKIEYIITRTTSGTERIPISMQYGESSVPPGEYNISVWAYADLTGQYCYRTALLAQTFR